MKTEESFPPVYVKLAQDLKQQILSGRIKPGDAIPTEAQLCKQYGISRMTVRLGLKLLSKEGLIRSYRGKGSFVAFPELNELILELPDSSPINSNDFSTRLLGVNIINPDPWVASILQLKSDMKVIRFKKLHFVKDEIVALDTRYIVYEKCCPVVEEEINTTFISHITKLTGFVSIRNKVTFSAISLSEETAELLNTYANKPVMQIEQLVCGINNQPLGVSVIICDSEKYKLSAYTKTFL